MAWRQQIMEESANRGRQQAQIFKEGDNVWLNLRNVTTPRPSKKLSWLHGKYKVVKIISPHVVELDMPTGVYPRFHVDLLKRAADDPLPSQTQDDFLPDPTDTSVPRSNQEWKVERILRAEQRRRGRGIQRVVLVKWEDLVKDLFQACLDTGHHPKCFRTAILAIIEKPKKLDMSSPRSYRPIALHSVLGKGLERLVAKRMSWIAIKHKLFTRQQFRALPLRSSVDLLTCLTHHIESALARGETASIATLDIKGAFDAVLTGRLVRRLREKGWPFQLCNWVGSFATEREVCIRLDGTIGDPRPIYCGLLQGSPVFPILFMLYISPLFRLNGLQKAFGYADDFAVLATSVSLQENTEKIRTAVNGALQWGINEGVTFDPGKSELLHFSRRNRDKHLSPQVHTNDFTIVEDTQKPYLKWLGVHFDQKLTFKHHVKTQAAKALKVANALRCIENTIRGVSPKLSKQMVAACILPVSHFGAETWWPGKAKVSRGKVVSNRVGSHLEALDKVHRACARAIFPVFRTTPSTALMREAGISPAQIELDNIARRAAVRTRKLDSRHLLYMRSQASSSSPATSKFSRWCRTDPPSEQVDPLAHPPWEIKESRENSLLRVGAPTVSNERRVDSFQTFLQNIPKSDILVYTDGSKQLNGNAGIGYVIYQLGLKVCSGAVPLGNSKEIFDAEAFAALCGIEKAVSLSSARFASNVWVFLDNLEVAIHVTP
ncbi:hypothetical protein K3495_g9465 [Podosphaera aphanis]|nr:hypothetical protein K3495_g9465 [Podosphaera aphanis]